mgnify:FL=1
MIAQSIGSTETEAPTHDQQTNHGNLIDWQMSLQRAGGKPGLAKDMLQMLLTSLPQTQQALNVAIAANDNEQLLQLIHKLHGACCYTGVPALKNLAETLETQLKTGTDIQQLEPELFELDDILSALCQLDSDWLAKIDLQE